MRAIAIESNFFTLNTSMYKNNYLIIYYVFSHITYIEHIIRVNNVKKCRDRKKGWIKFKGSKLIDLP